MGESDKRIAYRLVTACDTAYANIVVAIVYSKAARKALMRSNKGKLLRDKISQLADRPETLANNVTPLQGRQELRLRVQDWRVIFVRDEEKLMIRDIAPRASVYEE